MTLNNPVRSCQARKGAGPLFIRYEKVYNNFMATRQKGDRTMIWKGFSLAGLAFLTFSLIFCSYVKPHIPVNQGSVDPGTSVARGDLRFKLLGTPISVGKPLPPVKLVDAMTMQEVDLSQEKGSVLLLSLVPSVDTRVCEAQTHYLGEEGNILPQAIKRITVSRDTPFAQKRFAAEAKLTHIRFLSDYKQGEFGRAAGLLVEGSMLLARSVLVVDKLGIVRYIQVVPDMGQLPDMDRAFREALALNK
jgi:thiol peroxidase